MTIEIRWFDGDRNELRPLFALAEDSESQLASYMHTGDVLVALDGDALVGELLLAPTDDPGTLEIVILAVAESHQRAGIGRALVARSFDEARARGARRVTVATATASIDNLRFYQRAGFRMLRIDRDAFGPHTGYEPGMELNGIPMTDKIWFDHDL